MPAPRLTPTIIRALFAEALTLEFGIRLPIEAAYQDKAKQMISQTMKHTPERERVMVCAFPKANELWFLKRTVEIEI